MAKGRWYDDIKRKYKDLKLKVHVRERKKERENDSSIGRTDRWFWACFSIEKQNE